MQKPILIDLDGVLRFGTKPAEDINLFLDYLQKAQIPACILSNSSLNASEDIYKYFETHSINIELPIITAIDAAYSYIKDKYSKVAIYTSENVIGKFADFLEYENPEAVLIGDIGNLWNYKLMQTIFEYVQNGAELIAVHKNKYWHKPSQGILLDSGPFIHGIEYASGHTATLIGKPSPLYFNSALKQIGFEANQPFIMLGDDLQSDMAGGKELNAHTILMLTGKTELPIPEKDKQNINYYAENLTQAVEIIKIIKEV